MKHSDLIINIANIMPAAVCMVVNLAGADMQNISWYLNEYTLIRVYKAKKLIIKQKYRVYK